MLAYEDEDGHSVDFFIANDACVEVGRKLNASIKEAIHFHDLTDRQAAMAVGMLVARVIAGTALKIDATFGREPATDWLNITLSGAKEILEVEMGVQMVVMATVLNADQEGD